MRTTSDVFILLSASTLLPWKWSYRNVCVGWWGRSRTTQKRWEKSNRERICHILTTGKQCKTSNHSSARELEPVEKDPAPSMLNCGWWLQASHAWQCVRVWLLPACAHCCQPSLQVMNTVLRPCKRGLGQSGWRGWGLARAGATPHGHRVARTQITHS